MSIEDHEFRREKPNGDVLRAKLEKEGDGYVVKVQWLKPNGQPYHQPLALGLSSAEGVFSALSGFAKELKDRAIK